jgi:hypothetical protein
VVGGGKRSEEWCLMCDDGRRGVVDTKVNKPISSNLNRCVFSYGCGGVCLWGTGIRPRPKRILRITFNDPAYPSGGTRVLSYYCL